MMGRVGVDLGEGRESCVKEQKKYGIAVPRTTALERERWMSSNDELAVV